MPAAVQDGRPPKKPAAYEAKLMRLMMPGALCAVVGHPAFMVLFFRAAAGIGRFFQRKTKKQARPQEKQEGPDNNRAILIVVLVFGALIERAAFVVLHA